MGQHPGTKLMSIVRALAVVVLLMASSVVTFASKPAVAYQIDPAHTGSQSDGLTPPLVQRWSREFGTSLSTISYPLIVEGKVFVLVDNGPLINGTNLYALDQATGATVWGPIQDRFGSFSFAGLAYDNGRVFVLNFDGFLRAFNASSGAMIWETFLGGEYPDHRRLWAFTTPPTAVDGTVYVSGAGLGTEVLAVSGQDGTLKWFSNVTGGSHSSPAVSSSAVYVSYSAAATTALSPTTGQVLWQFRSPGGVEGRSPVLFNNRVYVRDLVFRGTKVLDASNGTFLKAVDEGIVGGEPPAPAFSGSMGYFPDMNRGLKARDATTLADVWTFHGDSPITTAAIVDNGYVYVASFNGTLYAVNAQTGVSVWSTNLGANFLQPDETNAKLTTGFAAANGMLVGSAGNRLIAFQSATPPSPQLLLDTSATLTDQVAALDSLLFLRDPFPVINFANLLNTSTDRNTRVIVFVANLQLLQNETASSVIVNLVDSSNQSYDIPAEDVRPVRNSEFAQVIFRLPDNLAPGVCTLRVKAHSLTSNPGKMTIK
jgi:outer membrane protein assembly factor BamB